MYFGGRERRHHDRLVRRHGTDESARGLRMKKLIVFDFDGVIADSETLANTVLAEIVTELGTPMTLDAAMRTFMGKRFDEVITSHRGRDRPAGCGLHVRRYPAAHAREIPRRSFAKSPAFAAIWRPSRHMNRCIASSSSPDRLAACLDMLGLADSFGAHVYSASHGDARQAASRHLPACGAAIRRRAPAEAIVLEDSEGGVRAAVAAGMTAIGFLGASHIRPGHGERLLRAGAHHIARNLRAVEGITRRLVA